MYRFLILTMVYFAGFCIDLIILRKKKKQYSKKMMFFFYFLQTYKQEEKGKDDKKQIVLWKEPVNKGTVKVQKVM